jgi:hypothetical protein
MTSALPAEPASFIDDNLARQRQVAIIETDILTLAGHINAAEYGFLKLIDAFNKSDGWQGHGIKSFAHWLNYRVGLSSVVAREKIRVAKRCDLPAIDEAFSTGQVSYFKVRAMTRVATSANEGYLLDIARYGSASHMEKLVGAYKKCKCVAGESSTAAATCNWFQADNGMFEFRIRLAADDGAVVARAIDMIVTEINERDHKTLQAPVSVSAGTSAVATRAHGDVPAQRGVATEGRVPSEEGVATEENVPAETSLPLCSEDNDECPWSRKRATAVTRLAESWLNGARSRAHPGDRCEILVHVNANAADIDHKIIGADFSSLDSGDSGDSGVFLAPEVARQLACDALIRPVAEDNDGNVVGIGRRSRAIPPRMRLALSLRDGGCRYPGCTERHWVEGHHIHHWADGGETNLDNLVTLCRQHHRALHRGEYRIDSQDKGDTLFINRHGRAMPSVCYPQFASTCEHAALEREQTARGLAISAQTADSEWDGGAMDMAIAIHGLLATDEDE